MFAVDEVEARVLEALRADAATSGLADAIAIDAEGGRVTVAGSVDDVDDEDAVVSIVEAVPGVGEVVSRLEVRGLTGTDERVPTAAEQGETS
jgi:osmotically-inducible protein OsmY